MMKCETQRTEEKKKGLYSAFIVYYVVDNIKHDQIQTHS
jgi:hypothetical protein